MVSVEFVQKRFTQTIAAAEAPGCNLTSVVLEVRVKLKFWIGNGVVYA
jgi:hypothetical protein